MPPARSDRSVGSDSRSVAQGTSPVFWTFSDPPVQGHRIGRSLSGGSRERHMELERAVRRGAMVVVTALAAVASGTLVGASASGNATTVVRGTDLPAGNRAQLTQVGCASVFDRGAAAQPMIGVSPGAGAIGKRSLAFAPAGGSAVGLVGYVASMASTTVAGLSVHADAGTSGVAYAGYQAPKDAGSNRMWIGRAAVSAPAGSG